MSEKCSNLRKFYLVFSQSKIFLEYEHIFKVQFLLKMTIVLKPDDRFLSNFIK